MATREELIAFADQFEPEGGQPGSLPSAQGPEPSFGASREDLHLFADLIQFEDSQINPKGRPASGIFPERGKPPKDIFDEFTSGVASGIDGTQMALYAIARRLGRDTGIASLEDYGQAGVKGNLDELALQAPTVAGFTDIDSMEGFVRWSAAAFGQAIPSLGLAMTGGGIGAALGKKAIERSIAKTLRKDMVDDMVRNGIPRQAAEAAARNVLRNPQTIQTLRTTLTAGEKVAAQRGAQLGAAFGATAISVPQQTGEALQDENVSLGTALAVGIAGGALEAAPVLRLLNKAFPGVDERVAGSFVKDFLKATGTQAVFEGSTEAAQQMLQIAASAYHDPFFDLNDPMNAKQVIDAFAAGALVGAVTGGGAEVISRPQKERKPRPKVDEFKIDPVQPDDGFVPADNTVFEEIRDRVNTAMTATLAPAINTIRNSFQEGANKIAAAVPGLNSAVEELSAPVRAAHEEFLASHEPIIADAQRYARESMEWITEQAAKITDPQERARFVEEQMAEVREQFAEVADVLKSTANRLLRRTQQQVDGIGVFDDDFGVSMGPVESDFVFGQDVSFFNEHDVKYTRMTRGEDAVPFETEQDAYKAVSKLLQRFPNAAESSFEVREQGDGWVVQIDDSGQRDLLIEDDVVSDAVYNARISARGNPDRAGRQVHIQMKGVTGKTYLDLPTLIFASKKLILEQNITTRQAFQNLITHMLTRDMIGDDGAAALLAAFEKRYPSRFKQAKLTEELLNSNADFKRVVDEETGTTAREEVIDKDFEETEAFLNQEEDARMQPATLRTAQGEVIDSGGVDFNRDPDDTDGLPQNLGPQQDLAEASTAFPSPDRRRVITAKTFEDTRPGEDDTTLEDLPSEEEVAQQQSSASKTRPIRPGESREEVLEAQRQRLKKESIANAREKKRQAALKKKREAKKKAEEAKKTAAKEGTTLNIWHGQGQNRELSNLAHRPFTWKGRQYESVEHAYQSNKSGTFDEATYNKNWKGGNKKIRGNKPVNSKISRSLMKELMDASFQQNPEAKQALLATGEATLTHEGGRPDFWTKAFPEILMELRKEYAPKKKAAKKPAKKKATTKKKATKSKTSTKKKVAKKVAKKKAAPKKAAPKKVSDERVRELENEIENTELLIYEYDRGQFSGTPESSNEVAILEKQLKELRAELAAANTGKPAPKKKTTTKKKKATKKPADIDKMTSKSKVEVFMRTPDGKRMSGVLRETIRELAETVATMLSDNVKIRIINRSAALEMVRKGHEHADIAEGLLDHSRFAVWYNENGPTYILVDDFVDAGASLVSLVHELGHVIHYDTWAQLSRDEQNALWDAFEEDVKAGRTTGASIRRSPRQGPDSRPMSPPGPASINNFEFREWMADNFVNWMANRREPKTALERFLETVAQKMDQFWEFISNNRGRLGTLNETYADFADAVALRIAKEDPTGNGRWFKNEGEKGRPIYTIRGGTMTRMRGQSSTQKKARRDRSSGKQARSMRLDEEGNLVDDVTGELLDDNGDPIETTPKGLTEKQWTDLKKRFSEQYPAIAKRAAKISQWLRDAYYLALAPSTSVMRSLSAKGITAADQLVQIFNRREHGKPKLIRNYHQRTYLMKGRFMDAFDRIFTDMTDAQKADLLKRLRKLDRTDGKPRSLRERQVRKIFDDIHEYLLSSGLPVGNIPNYFPRTFDRSRLIENENKIIRHVAGTVRKRHPNWKEEKVQQEARKFYNSLVSYEAEAAGALEQLAMDELSSQSPSFRAMRSRSIKSDPFWDQFLDDNIENIMANYINHAVKRAEYNRVLGEKADPNLIGGDKLPRDKWNPRGQLDAILLQAREQGATSRELKQMKDYVDANLGQYGRDSVPDNVRTAMAAMVAYQNMRVLLFTVFASLSDLTGPAIRSGNMRQSYKVMMKNIRDAATDNNDLAAMARAYGIISSVANQHVLTEYVDNHYMPPTLRKWNDKFFQVTGLNWYTDFTRKAALAVGIDTIKNEARKVNDQSLTQKQRDRAKQFLAELGLNADIVQSWIDGGERTWQGAGYDQERAADQQVAEALVQFVDESILRPNASQRPILASHPAAMLLYHLKGFMYAIHDTILKRLAHNWKIADTPAQVAAVIAPAIGMLLLTALGIELRELVTGSRRSDKMDGWDYTWEVAERSGLMGLAQLGWDFEGANARGQSELAGLSGPTISQLGDLISKPVSQTIPKAVPVVSQLPWARDALREATPL